MNATDARSRPRDRVAFLRPRARVTGAAVARRRPRGKPVFANSLPLPAGVVRGTTRALAPRDIAGIFCRQQLLPQHDASFSSLRRCMRCRMATTTEQDGAIPFHQLAASVAPPPPWRAWCSWRTRGTRRAASLPCSLPLCALEHGPSPASSPRPAVWGLLRICARPLRARDTPPSSCFHRKP